MLGRKTYTREELENARTVIDAQLAAWRALAEAADGSDPKAAAALEAMEPLLFNNMALVLDRYFVHRLRSVTGKDGNPLNEVELLSESLMGNDGVLHTGRVVKYKAAETVLKLDPGERIVLTADRFEQLAKAFFAELESKFR
jgi:hypothetical protein